MKKCSNCFKKKPLTEFYRKLDRHQSRCKACNAEVVAGYKLMKGLQKERFKMATQILDDAVKAWPKKDQLELQRLRNKQ